MTKVRCSSCGALIVELPRYLDGAVKIKCQECFGVAPQDASPEIDELLNRRHRHDLSRYGELGEMA
ncbi:MAG: hypothetical protein JSV65_15355 [Armatimonadota bacterium]|nr:MAG: hypothetical protein JSV65_15355 [Armatimonadota bacterium]